MTGASVSLTVTVKLHVLLPLPPSVAVHVTVVTPAAKSAPDGGVQVTVLHAPVTTGAA